MIKILKRKHSEVFIEFVKRYIMRKKNYSRYFKNESLLIEEKKVTNSKIVNIFFVSTGMYLYFSFFII